MAAVETLFELLASVLPVILALMLFHMTQLWMKIKVLTDRIKELEEMLEKQNTEQSEKEKP